MSSKLNQSYFGMLPNTHKGSAKMENGNSDINVDKSEQFLGFVMTQEYKLKGTSRGFSG